MPHDGKRFCERTRGKLSKEGNEIPRTKSTIVATSVLLEPDAKIKQPRIEIEGVPDEKTGEIKEIKTQKGAKKMQNVKKEETTPENNDVKTDSKE